VRNQLAHHRARRRAQARPVAVEALERLQLAQFGEDRFGRGVEAEAALLDEPERRRRRDRPGSSMHCETWSTSGSKVRSVGLKCS